MSVVCDAPIAAMPARYVLERGEVRYPAALHELRDAPPRLYVWGGALPAPGASVAVVGARAATPYGLTLATRLAGDLAAQGVTVVSGLAHGIDAAAHRAALAAGGRTIAVIASSLSQVTPADHVALAREIAASGAVVSEVAEGGPFGRGAFVKRNRLIAALTALTVVVEAGERSGALATASYARALGRGVLAVPGDVDRPGSRGTLALLRTGARPCADAGDVLALLSHSPSVDAPPATRLRSRLGREPASVERLSAVSGLSAPEVLALLLRLQWSGLAVLHPGGRWSART